MGKTFRMKDQETSRLFNSFYVPMRRVKWGYYVSLTHKEIMRKLHREFGDHSSGQRNAPKHFRQELNKIKAAKDRVEMLKALDPEYDASFAPYRKDANWEYW